MPAVVSDTSPLIYLTRLGHFGWLREFYGEVLIPPAVWREITEGGAVFPESDTVRRAVEQGWMKVQTPTPRPLAGDLAALDPGELEAIQLAQETGGLLIIDEAAGRHVATAMGLRIIGILGVLLEGKTRNLIPLVRPELDRLTHCTTFRLSEDLRLRVLSKAGEMSDNS